MCRLFCFPYAGGGASIYRRWADAVPPCVEVHAVQLPGRETRLREAPSTSMSSLVEAVVSALEPLFDKPFAFFGHSMGAIIAFELARQLRRDYGDVPEHLFVSGRCAPQLPPKAPELHTLPEDAFVEALVGLNGTPREVLEDPDLRRLLIPLLRADCALCETYPYAARAPLPCPISAFGGVDDRHVSRAELQAWRQQTSGPFFLRMFPGDHFYLRTAESLLLQTISEQLALAAASAR